jgi:transcriptional regulator with XRE-family HTH domain
MANSSGFQIQAKKLGVLIKDARLASERSEEDCAKAMGVTHPEYEAFEKGEKAPSLPELEALGFYLDVPIDHFLDREPISFEAKENIAIEKLDHLLPLRHRIIGIMMRKARLEADISLEELARYSEIDQENLSAYEMGAIPIPLPELEVIAVALNLSMREFRDQNGPIGKWAIQKKAIEDFMELPLDMQQFISKPVNLPYLELAQRLSEMSVDRLRGVAEGLLEITL